MLNLLEVNGEKMWTDEEYLGIQEWTVNGLPRLMQMLEVLKSMPAMPISAESSVHVVAALEKLTTALFVYQTEIEELRIEMKTLQAMQEREHSSLPSSETKSVSKAWPFPTGRSE